jgi:hypothetical protein
VASGYSLLFDAKQIGQGEKGFSRSLDSRERSQQIPFSPFGRLEREGKEGEKRLSKG